MLVLVVVYADSLRDRGDKVTLHADIRNAPQTAV